MNAPERTSAFLLDEDIGETKVVYTSDTKVCFCSKFVARNLRNSIDDIQKILVSNLFVFYFATLFP